MEETTNDDFAFFLDDFFLLRVIICLNFLEYLFVLKVGNKIIPKLWVLNTFVIILLMLMLLMAFHKKKKFKLYYIMILR